MEKLKKITTKFLTLAATIVISAQITLAATAPQITNQQQYPAKYTPEYIQQIRPGYKAVGKDEVFYVALDMLKDTDGMFSRNAILGNNLSQKPVKIEFKDLGQFSEDYKNFDALGWKKVKTYTSIST